MKPTKNRFYCIDCGKAKMRFETEKKADTFIKFNAKEIEEESGIKPERSYFCIACNCWHITSIRKMRNLISKTEIVLVEYSKYKEYSNPAKTKKLRSPSEINRIANIQMIEQINKVTKSLKESLKKELKDIESNVEWINTLNKLADFYKYNETLNISQHRMEIVKTMLLELNRIYEKVITDSAVMQYFLNIQKRIQYLEEMLTNMKQELLKNK